MPPAPYTAESVDALFDKFETCARRQNANKASAVKLRAAESDLLKASENARDLLGAAVKGDRDLLVQVFGGDNKRFQKLQQVKETVELSPMHINDQRWQDLTDMMETVEEILKQLGTFRPFVMEKKVAPEIGKYKGWRSRFTPGDDIEMRPETDGVPADSFAIKPALPKGLEFNKETGEITGSIKAGEEVKEQKYVVTARNAYGTTNIELSFSIAQPAPEKLGYGEVPGVCYTNESIDWMPEIEGGAPKNWTVSPALPEGLSLDPQTGAISGIPTKTTEAKDYVIKASNASGSVSATLNFGVKPAPPVSLTFPDAKPEYAFGEVIYLHPEVGLKVSGGGAARPMSANWDRLRSNVLKGKAGGGTSAAQPDMSFSVEPALPEGLVLINKTGVISGKAIKPCEEKTYKVTCKTAGGEISTDLTFGVKLIAPSKLNYQEESLQFFIGKPVSLTPEVEGFVSEWVVEPALPPGLRLDPALGIISGIPSGDAMPEGAWKITAKNAEGEVSADLKFSVSRQAPKGLEYPALLEEYPVACGMEPLHPKVEGEVESFSVSPALPEGMSLDPKTGVITGMPTGTVEPKTYVVSASNETGAAKAELTFGVRVMAPQGLSYPQVDDTYCIGESVDMTPQCVGGATKWSVEPALPEGLSFNEDTGAITGKPTKITEEASYVVTASNEAGGTSTVLTFAITAPKPEGLSYPDGTEMTMGQPVNLEPTLESGICATFTVEPALPEGLSLDPNTGVISGEPTAVLEPQVFMVFATNPTGSCSAPVMLGVVKPNETDDVTGVNQKFAAMIEEVTDIADLCEEPGKSNNLGDWMIWMVHRAWLNDPSLSDFNFCNKWMPPPHMEPRIAPKLMKAMGHNTHIVSLQLANANVMKPQGHQLAKSLSKNTTLRVLNLETNSLDSDGLHDVAESLKANEGCILEQLKFNNQKGLGGFFGRPVEQAFAELADANSHILKLGFTCNDPHWRMKIDRALLKNNDLARRRRKGKPDEPEAEEVAAKDKTLAKLVFFAPPEKPAWDVFDPENERATLVRLFMATNHRLPTKEQLQAFARSQSKSIPYSAVATVVKDFRAQLVNAGVNSKVKVFDAYGAETQGTLRGWTEKNDRWNLDVWVDGATRFNFAADKQPILEISEEFSEWLKPAEQ